MAPAYTSIRILRSLEKDGVVSRDAVLGAMAAMPPGRRACAVAVLPWS